MLYVPSAQLIVPEKLAPWESTVTVPPSALIVPELLTLSLARRYTSPFMFCSESAFMSPSLFTAFSNRSARTFDVRRTVPPSAIMVPVFSTASSMTFPSSSVTVAETGSSMATDILPMLSSSRVIFSPAASATLPSLACIIPSLRTAEPKSTTYPSSSTVIWPLLITYPVLLGSLVKI